MNINTIIAQKSFKAPKLHITSIINLQIDIFCCLSMNTISENRIAVQENYIHLRYNKKVAESTANYQPQACYQYLSLRLSVILSSSCGHRFRLMHSTIIENKRRIYSAMHPSVHPSNHLFTYYKQKIQVMALQGMESLKTN